MMAIKNSKITLSDLRFRKNIKQTLSLLCSSSLIFLNLLVLSACVEPQVSSSAAKTASASTAQMKSDATTTAESSAPTQDAVWQANMNKMAVLLAKTIHYANLRVGFSTSDRENLLGLAKDFRQLSKSISHTSAGQSVNSTFQKSAAALEDELQDVQFAVEHKQDMIAQQRLMHVTQYCISCHTMREGYEKTFSTSVNSAAQSLSDIEKADFYSATRQFDEAILQYEKILSDANWAKSHPKEWNTSALKLLAILVRVKNNPNLTLEMVSRFFDVNSYPKEFKPAAHIWRKEIQKWEAQESKAPTPIQLSSVNKLLAESTRLNVTNGGGLIQDLRASRILFLLQAETAKTENPNALDTKWYIYTGEVAQRLRDLNIWDVPSDYFSQCVRINPKSRNALRCLKYFILAGFKEFKERDQSKWPPSFVNEMQELKKLMGMK